MAGKAYGDRLLHWRRRIFFAGGKESCGVSDPLAGIHMGELGFLNSITPLNMKMRFQDIREKKYTVEKRVFLESWIEHANGMKTVLPGVLNDIVVGHDTIGKMSRLRLWINGNFPAISGRRPDRGDADRFD